MALPIYNISDTFSVAGQLYPSDMNELVNLGFKSVIINRPDGEAGDQQPSGATMLDAAREAGLEAAFQPVVIGAIGPRDVQAFSKLLAQLPTPIVAYCKSGGRCLQLYQASMSL